MKNNNARVMVLWHANPNPYSPPVLSDNQITGVLDEYASQPFNFGSEKFTFPRGEFDLEELLKSKNIAKPDYLFICLDSTTSYFARNIENICGNTFLCLGDTHHLPQPITRVLNYASNEKFNGHIFTNNVRHAHWFKELCDADQYFEPALFALDLESHLTEQISSTHTPKGTPVFYGQIGPFHPRRRRIMPNLVQANLVQHISGSQADLSSHMQKAMACVNVTLNSDLNSRVFEIAQTGCLQIVDQLSTMNGHGSVLIPGHNCLTFQNEIELTELLNQKRYLVEVGKILGKTLRHEFNNFWGLKCIKTRLQKTIDNTSPRFNPVPSQRNTELNTFSQASLQTRLFIYENFLELHRSTENISLLIESPNSDEYKNNLKDLPRISFPDKDKFLNDKASSRYYIKEYEIGKPEIFAIN